MTWTPERATPRDLRCDACGQLPEAPRFRTTVASIAAVLPIELAVHLVVLQTGLPLLAKVAVLAVTATILVVWVAEPSLRRILWAWLHGRELRKRRMLDASPALWRVRVTFADRSRALRRVTRAMDRIGAGILSIHVHQLPVGVMNEVILSAPDGISAEEVREAVQLAGGTSVSVSPSTPVAATDSQTRALSLATRVAADPDALEDAIAELLRADAVGAAPTTATAPRADGPLLKVPSVRQGTLTFSRRGEPFTPAESARAHRLAELAELTTLARLNRPAAAE